MGSAGGKDGRRFSHLYPLANPARVIPPTVACVVHNVIGQECYPVKVGFRPPLPPFPLPPPPSAKSFVDLFAPVTPWPPRHSQRLSPSFPSSSREYGPNSPRWHNVAQVLSGCVHELKWCNRPMAKTVFRAAFAESQFTGRRCVHHRLQVGCIVPWSW